MSQGGFSVVLFDLDGTLADSLPHLYQVYAGFLASFGKEASRSEFEHLSGKTLAEIIESLTVRHRLDLPSEVLLPRYRRLIEECYAGAVRPDPEAVGLLQDLVDQGFRLGLVTSGALGPAAAFLESHGLRKSFEHLVTSEDFVRGKPDPEPYLKALAAFSIEAGEALAIEDSNNGVLSARAAGIKTLRLAGRQGEPDSIARLSGLWDFIERGQDGCRILPLAGPVTVRACKDAPASLGSGVLEKVELAWSRENSRRQKPLTNGSMFVFTARADAHTILGRFTEYKYYVAQRSCPDLFGDLRVMPLAVSAMAVVEDAVVFGRRSSHVTAYPGFWELVPAGGITSECLTESGLIDYEKQILAELREEVGVPAERVKSVAPFALIFDQRDRVYDLCLEVRLNGKKDDVSRWPINTHEHSCVSPVAFGDLDAFVEERRTEITPTTLGILRAAKSDKILSHP